MKLYIWGTGRLIGKVLGEYIKEEQVTGFIDNDFSKKHFMGKQVFSPEEIAGMEYDVILVVTIYSQEIYKQSKKLGLDLDKIIFVYNNFSVKDINQNYELAQKVLGNQYSDVIKNRYLLVRRNEATETKGKVLHSGYSEMDYVRIKTFELVSEEIREKHIQGSVAEVGVFRGEFAQYINAAFPEKKLYLFDTFEGFAETEAEVEVERGNATNAIVEAYKDTNVNMVMDKIKYPENVIIRKGLFPESLKGLEEKFAFVSIDVDFEQSIFDCLQYFYPRVLPGGYIFVHDYNSSLKGVKAAVKKYEDMNGIMLHTVPLCDANGTLVITR